MKKALFLAAILVAFLALAGMAANLAGFAVDTAEPKTLSMDTPAELPTKVKRSLKVNDQPQISLDNVRELGATLLISVTREPWS